MSFVMLNLVLYVDVEIRLRTRLCNSYFYVIFLIWDPHFNFKSTCTPNTLTESFAFFRIPSILIVTFMLNFFGYITKYINSYFSGTNFVLCLRVQLVYLSWMPFRIRQFRSVEWSYIRMYVSSTNSIIEVRNPSFSIVFKSSVIKNRNRIGEIEDSCGILILIVKRYDSL